VETKKTKLITTAVSVKFLRRKTVIFKKIAEMGWRRKSLEGHSR